MRVLVTGGAGFLGGSMVESLIRQGTTVDVIDDFSIGRRNTVPNGVSDIINGRVNKENLEPLIGRRYNVAFHYAAPCTVLQFKEQPIETLKKAAEAAYNVRLFCRDAGVPYLVYASSATWYGSTTESWTSHSDKYQEELPPRPDNIYAVSKVMEEAMDTLFPEVKTLALRLFPVYGARERVKGGVASVPYKFLTDMLWNKPPEIWGDGNQKRDYIYIHDAAYCTRTLVERGATGPFSLGTGECVTTNELVSAINTLVGKDIKPTYVHPPGYKYTATLHSDPSKLLTVIGRYEFTNIVDGLADMLEEME